MIKPKIIGVSGGSGSGKTTFAKGLAEKLGGPSYCSTLSQDHYYIDQSAHFKGDGENVNFDDPASLDFELLAIHLQALKSGRPIQAPVYDFPTHKRLLNTTTFNSTPFVIVDGILILSQEKVRRLLDYSIFIETQEPIRFKRRLKRDTAERGRHPDGVKKQFLNQVKPMHDIFVEPSKVFAHEIISGESKFDSDWNRIGLHLLK